jgi:hypothetical protein
MNLQHHYQRKHDVIYERSSIINETPDMQEYHDLHYLLLNHFIRVMRQWLNN